MAQLIFNPITGGISTIDNQTVLAVQSFLESSETIMTETVPTLDDEDVFQCGKCKKQFTSLNLFMNHKKEQCLPINAENAQETTFVSSSALPTTSSNTNLVGSPLGSLVLSETDLLSLTLDGTATLPSLQALTSGPTSILQSVKPAERIGAQGLSNQSSSNSVGVSLLSNAMLSSSGLLLTSQGNGAGTTNLVLTITNPSVLEKEDTASADVPNVAKTKVVTSKTDDAKKNHAVNVITQFAGNAVNVITQFTGNAVKTKKKTVSTKSSLNVDSQSGDVETSATKKGVVKPAQSLKMKCTFCDKSFSKNFDLQQHVRCHTGEKPFQCIICGRAFAQKSNVKKHIQTHKVWPDGLCSTLPCSTPGTEKKSTEIESSVDTLPGKENDVEKDDSAKVDNSYVCPYCQFSGKTYFELKGHMKEHKNKKVFKCILATCAQMYEDLDSFLDHVKSHETEITYHCHLCPKKFPCLYDLGVHQYSHSLYPNKPTTKFKKTFRCSSCLNKYSTSTALDHHMATCSHNYPCPHCSKRFPCERYLRRHLLIHSNRSAFVCPICSKSFKAEHYLRIHKLIHTGEKPFTCPHCETSFNRNDKLKRHLLIHEPLKRFKCPFRNHSGCMKEFNRPDKLKAHVLTHGQGKPFFCRTCGRSFTRRAQLNAHQLQHEEEKDYPFQCCKCGSGFLNQEIYQSHVCVQYPTRRWRTDTRYQRSARLRRAKFNLLRSRKKLKKQVPEEENITEETLLEDDGIPTAHIEIISTTGDLGQVNELSQISLQLHPLVETGSKESGQSRVIQNFSSAVFNYDLQEMIPVKSASCAEFIEDDITVETGEIDGEQTLTEKPEPETQQHEISGK